MINNLKVIILKEDETQKEVELKVGNKYLISVDKHKYFQYESEPVVLQRIVMDDEKITEEEIKQYYGVLTPKMIETIEKGKKTSVIRLVFQKIKNGTHIILIVDPETLTFKDCIKHKIDVEEMSNNEQS